VSSYSVPKHFYGFSKLPGPGLRLVVATEEGEGRGCEFPSDGKGIEQGMRRRWGGARKSVRETDTDSRFSGDPNDVGVSGNEGRLNDPSEGGPRGSDRVQSELRIRNENGGAGTNLRRKDRREVNPRQFAGSGVRRKSRRNP